MLDLKIQEGIHLIKAGQEEGANGIRINNDQIVFIYNDKKPTELVIPNLNLNQDIKSDILYTFSNPRSESILYFNLESEEAVNLLIMEMSVLHSFFGSSFGSNKEDISTFMTDYKVKKYVTSKDIHPSLKVVFHQIFNCNLEGLSRELYVKSKLLEFLSLYIHNPARKKDFIDNCPFVDDHLEMEKIREAKRIITERITSPPSLKELAKEVGTNEFKLKVGFKSLYGTTVYSYLTDYRMETARKMLEDSKTTVKEVSDSVGYSNPSHFITNYKKKFGVTPKQYLKGVRV